MSLQNELCFSYLFSACHGVIKAIRGSALTTALIAKPVVPLAYQSIIIGQLTTALIAKPVVPHDADGAALGLSPGAVEVS